MAGIKLIEHQVDNHAGHRDVQPHRKGPSGDTVMTHELSTKGASQSHDYERHERNRQYRMRNQNRVVRRPYPSHSPKTSNPSSEADVINEIRDQEQTRADYRRDHTRAMSGDTLSANQDEPAHDQDSSRCVQDCVERR